MHYYQHHIGDFIRDTANLNDHQVATYLRMLWAYYDSEKPISGELEDIAFAMRSDEKTVRLLLRHYFKEAEDGWHHTRCDKEIAEYRKAKLNHWGRRLTKDQRAAAQGERNAAKANATPRWLTKQDRALIAEIYAEAATKTASTGVKHEVDHIIPLRSKQVCGLHVPWNLRAIPSHKNRAKSNILIET